MEDSEIEKEMWDDRRSRPIMGEYLCASTFNFDFSHYCSQALRAHSGVGNCSLGDIFCLIIFDSG